MPPATGNHSGPRVVHSSPGRLRVHLPDPDGQVAAQLRLLPGVISAQANPWTDNVLILFNPQQTSEQTLLAQLPACPAAPARPPPTLLPAVVEPAVENVPAGYVTGVRRRVYKVLGWSSVGMAFVGAATPGIPTVPFAILAGYFFIRSSPAAHQWLLQSRWLGPLVREWEEFHGVRRSVKVAAGDLMAAGLGVSVLVGLPPALIAAIAALEVVGLVVVVRLPEAPPAPAA